VTDGTNAVPCLGATLDCTAASGDTFGVLPSYNAASGFDLATGLGSVNVTNLVTGWISSAASFLPTTVSLSAAGATTVAYGTSINLKVAVASSQNATSIPSGDVGITSNGASPNSDSIADGTLSTGSASIVAQGLSVGSYQLFAHYAGDTVYAPGESSGVAVVITRGPSALALTSSRQTVELTQNVTVSAAVTGVPGGTYPTGTVTFTDSTSGASLGMVTLSPDTSYGSVLSSAFVAITRAQLQKGANTIVASYSGDANYVPGTAMAVTVTSIDPFTTTINPSALTLSPSGTGAVTVTITPNGSAVLSPSALALSCPSGLPTGLACAFSSPVVGTGGAVTSTLTLTSASPLIDTDTAMASAVPSDAWKVRSAFAGLGLLVLMGRSRRRKSLPTLLLIGLAAMSASLGCGGASDSSSSKPEVTATVTTLSINPSAPAYNTPVTLTASVAPVSESGVPTGSVTFSAGSNVLGNASLVSGVAKFQANSLPVGSQLLTATYSGDTSYTGSKSASDSVDVRYTTTLVVAAVDTAGNSSSAGLTLTIQ
jgi:hypothetical protein